MTNNHYTIAHIAAHVGAQVQGDGDIIITHVAPLQSADEGSVTFLDNARYRKTLSQTQASAVILAAKDASQCPVTAIITDKPYLTYAKVAELFLKKRSSVTGIHPSAVIHESAVIGQDACIAAHVVIGENVQIGQGVTIGANVVIDNDCIIGEGTVIHPNVTLYQTVRVGCRCVIHAGAVLGADGFGIAREGGAWRRVPQLGGVLIGDDVDIGANTTIDRGAIADTRIGNDVKLDNQIQIGHNVVIGDHTAIAGCAGIAGSAIIGQNCIIGGGAGINGHIELADNVSIAGMSAVRNSIPEPGIYNSGIGAIENRQWQKTEARLRQINEMAQRLNQIEKKVDAL